MDVDDFGAPEPATIDLGLSLQSELYRANRRLQARRFKDGLGLFLAATKPPEELRGKKFQVAEEDRTVITYEWRLHPTRFRFVNATHAIFNSLQAVAAEAKDNLAEADSDDTGLRSDLKLKLSGFYRIKIEQHISYLKSISLQNLDSEEQQLIENEISTFKNALAIWHLSEIVFVSSIMTDTFADDFVRWLYFNFQDEEDQSFSTNDDSWEKLYRKLIRGDLNAAILILNSLDDATETTLALQDAIYKMPRRSQKQFGSSSEFLMEWNDWKKNTAILSETSLDGDHRVEQCFKFISGDTDTQGDVLRMINASWSEIVAAKLMFIEPTIQSYDIAAYVDEAITEAPPTSDLDRLFVSLLGLNTTEPIALCSRIDLWIAAHLADFLHHCGVLDMIDISSEPSKQRNFFVLEYGQMLLNDPVLWQVGVDYLKTVPDFGLDQLELSLERVPLSSYHVAEKILGICDECGFEYLKASTHRRLARQALDAGQISAAMAHYDIVGDGRKVAKLAEILLKQYWEKGTLNFVDLTDSLGRAAFESDCVQFLGTYARFHDLYSRRQFRAAGRLLVEVMTKNLAPKHFWPVLLVDALPLLENEKIVFNVDDTYELMHCLEDVFNSPTLISTVSHAQMEVVQLALVRHLARTTIAAA